MVLLVAAGGMALSVGLLYLSVDSYLDGRAVDRIDQAQERIRAVGRSGSETAVRMGNLASLLPRDSFVILVGPGGGVIASFGDPVSDPERLLARVSTAAPPPATAGTEALSVRVSDVSLIGGDPYLVTRIPMPQVRVVLARGSEPSSVDAVVIGMSVADDEDTKRRVLLSSSLIAGLVLVGVAVTSAALLRVSLRPLHRVVGQVREVGGGSPPGILVPDGSSRETDELVVALREAFQDREDAEERVRSFVADASHELRTPLATVAGWIDLHQQGGLTAPGALEAAFDRMAAQTARMSTLVGELGLLARLDAGRRLNREPVDVGEVAAEVVDDARVVHNHHPIDLDAAPGAWVEADRERIAQVLHNLVGNAAQHTRAGTRVHVRVTADPSVEDRQARTVRVVVSDEGAGIPASDLPHVFDRFWRGDSSRTRETGGSGLGLPIVHSIVAAYGGNVSIESSTSGTTVTVDLPIRKPSGR